MASTYSDLKIELIATGEQTGTWGSTTNTNLGTAIEEAITGSATVTFSSSDVTLTLTDTNTTQAARNLRLVCSGTSGGARNLILGSGCQIEKLYLIQNDLADTVTVKNTTGTGVAVAAGARTFVFNDGTNVTEATNVGGLSGIVPIANGGTGASTATNARTNLGLGTLATLSSINNANWSGTDLAVTNGGTGASDAATARTNLGLGTIATQASNNVSITGGSITGITDLAVTDGGTGSSTASGARTNLGLGTLSTLNTINNGNWSGTDLAVVNGGTGASDAGTARTNLGLGSMATQASGTVSISGGNINALTTLSCYGGGGLATNTALGDNALDSNTTGTGSTAIGANALTNNTTHVFNTAVGANALQFATANYNTAVGAFASFYNETGEKNVAIGYSSLLNATACSFDVAIGFSALDSATNGSYNVAVGAYAADGLTTGSANVCIGYSSGNTFNSGSNNITLGYYSQVYTNNSTYQIVIGSSVVATSANSTVTIGSNSGKIYNAYTVNATWTQTSDERLKKNIQNDSLGLSFINRLRPVKYQWKPSYEIDPSLPYYNEENNRDTETVMHGLVAQEVKAALDAEGVSTFAGWDVDEDSIQAISREMFISPLINAIKELSAKCDALQAEVDALKGQ